MVGERHIGLVGATTLGVGAIVGGGILALAGVAFATAGPAAILAFAFNGVIALLTVHSFASLARRFPESGGVYTYSKKVLSIEVAFVVGWVVWFASIVAGVLYALGFAAFAAEGLGRGLPLLGVESSWLRESAVRVGIALAVIVLYALSLVRRVGGGKDAATIGKVVVFVVLIGGGIFAWLRGDAAELVGRLTPFAPTGSLGIVQAMGYTFIALQGFDLIAAVGGEVRDPERTIPRAMYLSLGIALVIYLPLLFLLETVGASPDVDIASAAAANPEGFVAEAVERYLGTSGYWLVIGAGVLSMLSALRANMVGASRVAFAMAKDRTMPRRVGKVHESSGSPAIAVGLTAVMLGGIVVAVGNVAAAGAASSLIFLIAFAIVHWAAVLANRRSAKTSSVLIPLVGAALCVGLAVFQAIAVPEAGRVIGWWLLIGGILYLTVFAPGASLADASAEATDPDLARLRGRSPLVLVPIANPDSAASLVDVAATLRTPGTGRVLLLSVVRAPSGMPPADGSLFRGAQELLGESLTRSFERDLIAETLFTIAPDSLREIARVARTHACETVLLGLPDLSGEAVEARTESLLEQLEVDTVILRAPRRWSLNAARRVLVPIGGGRDQSHLRARLLSSLIRTGNRDITYFHTIPSGASSEDAARAERDLRNLARDEVPGPHQVLVERTDDPQGVIVRRAAESDLVVMGTQRRGRGNSQIGRLPIMIARQIDVPLILISRRAQRSLPLGLEISGQINLPASGKFDFDRSG
jgi:amino acid transporter/nucleotide-binding universal stress UspA family protein